MHIRAISREWQFTLSRHEFSLTPVRDKKISDNKPESFQLLNASQLFNTLRSKADSVERSKKPFLAEKSFLTKKPYLAEKSFLAKKTTWYTEKRHFNTKRGDETNNLEKNGAKSQDKSNH